MEAALTFVMGAALGFIGGALYVEWKNRIERKVHEQYEPTVSEIFKEEA